MMTEGSLAGTALIAATSATVGAPRAASPTAGRRGFTERVTGSMKTFVLNYWLAFAHHSDLRMY